MVFIQPMYDDILIVSRENAEAGESKDADGGADDTVDQPGDERESSRSPDVELCMLLCLLFC